MESTENDTITKKDESNIIDTINLEIFQSEFSSILYKSKYSVYGISGNWGVGKTTFVKKWEGQEKNDNIIHIDAFENDYESDAFLVIFCALYKHLKKIKRKKTEMTELLNDSKDYLLNIAKATGKAAISIAIDKTIGNDIAKTFINDCMDTYFEDILKKALKEQSTHEKLVKTLEKITSTLKNEIIIVIDELDRCRPSFALEMLEKIKHIFSVEKVKFVLVYNKEIFEKIIEKEYGLKDGGSKYLNKFIEKEIIFPSNYVITDWLRNEIENDIEEYNSIEIKRSLLHLIDNICNIKNAFHISLRDISLLINKMKSYSSNNSEEITILLTIEFLRYLNYKELQDVVDYIIKNDILASNAPQRGTLHEIYSMLSINMTGQRKNDMILRMENKLIEIVKLNELIKTI